MWLFGGRVSKLYVAVWHQMKRWLKIEITLVQRLMLSVNKSTIYIHPVPVYRVQGLYTGPVDED